MLADGVVRALGVVEDEPVGELAVEEGEIGEEPLLVVVDGVVERAFCQVPGERNAEVLARHRNARVKAKREDVVRALTGNWREEHLFVLKQALSMYDAIGRQLAECDAQLQTLLGRRLQGHVEVGRAPKAGSKQASVFLPCTSSLRTGPGSI